MSVEQSIQDMKEDMREIKDALREIKQVLGSFSERFVSNEKDLERMINEYVRVGADFHRGFEEIKKNIRDQDDLIWQEIRRCQADCKLKHEKAEEHCAKISELSKIEVKKDIKAWLAFTIVAAIGAIFFQIIAKVILKVFP